MRLKRICTLAQREGLWVNKISRIHYVTLPCCVPNKSCIVNNAGMGTRLRQTSVQTRISAKAKWSSLRCAWQNSPTEKKTQ